MNSELKRNARELLQTTKPNPLLTGLAYFALVWFMNYLTTRLTGATMYIDEEALQAGADAMEVFTIEQPNLTFMSVLLSLALSLLIVMLSTGFTIYALRVSRGESAGWANLFDGFSMFFRVLWLHILMFVFIYLWSLLLFIPGMIAAYKYSQALYLLLDHPDWSARRCLRESTQLMRGHKWELFCLQLSFIGWQLLCLCPPVQIYVNPYIEITYALYYNRLIGWTPADSSAYGNDYGGEKPPWEY